MIQFNNGTQHFAADSFPLTLRAIRRAHLHTSRIYWLSVPILLSANNSSLFTTQSRWTPIVSLISFTISFCLLYPWQLSKAFLLVGKRVLYFIQRVAFFALACAQPGIFHNAILSGQMFSFSSYCERLPRVKTIDGLFVRGTSSW